MYGKILCEVKAESVMSKDVSGRCGVSYIGWSGWGGGNLCFETGHRMRIESLGISGLGARLFTFRRGGGLV